MKKIINALLLFSVLSFTAQAQAFFVEPFASYMVNGDIGNPSQDLSGTTFGLRAGGSTLGFLYGAEYNMSTWESETSSSVKTDWDGTNIGLVVGYEFPIMLRAWLTYNFSQKLEKGNYSYEGSGYKLGVGYTGFPFVVIGVEMASYNYDKGELSGTTLTGVDFDLKATMLTISVPLP